MTNRVRSFGFTLAAVVALVVASVATPAESAESGGAATAREAPTTCVPAAQCCKVCSGGQACGASCISRKKTCHKGHGCACDAAEVCP